MLAGIAATCWNSRPFARWIVDRATGRIVDPTIGQFEPGPDSRVIEPSDPLYDNYKSWA